MLTSKFLVRIAVVGTGFTSMLTGKREGRSSRPELLSTAIDRTPAAHVHDPSANLKSDAVEILHRCCLITEAMRS